MDGSHQLVRLGRDEANGANLHYRPLPQGRDAGQREQVAALGVDVVGVLLAAEGLPLVEPARRNEAAGRPKRVLERWLLRDRFTSGVGEPVSNGRVLRPAGYQAPAVAIGVT